MSCPFHFVVYYFVEHQRRFSSRDLSQPSKLAFSYDIKYRINVELLIMYAFCILSLLVTPFISRRTFMSAAWIRLSKLFVVTQNSCPYRAMLPLVWFCVSPVLPGCRGLLGYPSINFFLYSPIVIDIASKLFEIVHYV